MTWASLGKRPLGKQPETASSRNVSAISFVLLFCSFVIPKLRLSVRKRRYFRFGGRQMSSSMILPTSSLFTFSVMRMCGPFSSSGIHTFSPVSPIIL